MYGAKIQAIRLARGFTQEFMAKELDMPQTAYSKIETDQRARIDDILLDKIAKILGVSALDIKSPTPIIMNFDNCSHNSNSQIGAYSTQSNHINEKVLEKLFSELDTKNQQIFEL